ncbi:MAG: transposase [Nocardioidaceae bacterium]
MYVLTVDQRGSRRYADAVPALLTDLNAAYADLLVLPFERTAGDEVQGLLSRADVVVDLAVELVRRSAWSVGIGVGETEDPLPDSVRAGRGEAYVLARASVERAKSAPHPVCVGARRPEAAGHAEAACWLLAGVLARRTAAGWEAVDAMETHERQVDAADALGITPQAMSRRLRVAGWTEERRGRTLAAYLLQEAS